MELRPEARSHLHDTIVERVRHCAKSATFLLSAHPPLRPIRHALETTQPPRLNIFNNRHNVHREDISLQHRGYISHLPSTSTFFKAHQLTSPQI